MTRYLICLFLFLSQSILAVETIAILDNQIDYTHPKLERFLWNNPLEYDNSLDDDGNTYVDDTNGWNFIDNTNELFDFSLFGTFPSDVYKYYRIRAKKTLGTISKVELSWYKAIRKDEEFMEKRKEFARYIHGSHIACLAIDGNRLPRELAPNDIAFIPIRYLGDAEVGTFKTPEFEKIDSKSKTRQLKHIRKYLKSYTQWMVNKFDLAINYVKPHTRIVNASWGQSSKSARNMVKKIFETQFGDDSKYAKEQEAIALRYLTDLITRGTTLLREHGDMLFVFSAGNKDQDTDSELHYPSSIILPNVISVGAHDEKIEKAYFSNYGKYTVSLFAPGVAVESCTPEGRSLPVNGTSQATPQVASVALKIFAMADKLNLNLTPAKVKRIILASTKKYKSLKSYSASGGVLDAKKAYQTTRLIKRLGFKRSIDAIK